MTELNQDILEDIFQKKEKGYSSAEIRLYLEKKELEEPEIKAYFNELDQLLLTNTYNKDLWFQYKVFYWAGVIALLIGGIFTLLFYKGWLPVNKSRYLFYFLVVGGYACIWYSRFLKKKIR